ncbi:Bug family tripartite tricarboxylate transporter substrate binding protein [Cupriavidus taiwanensis]|uniref:Extra-cytoplasmic solute receptor n=1 Tax=Cupriavidus taiwanensis TaxID=164546 RepID=A0A7Z7JFF0_9BURK|nr:tripartite tricarboxylate transporter substrate binding protein [Cupriavidus taiwanensis]SOZ17201.1 conserved exported hypothetical protein [Cupriavidus taiwanensis]SOZ96472.1 conserved exported hypothetical protein [Cupriavidus taiwanensis]SPC25584.1 conserved exported hypothetical protein [Cupriavidus taiwanensis]
MKLMSGIARSLAAFFCVGATLVTNSTFADEAANYPNKPVKIVVPYAAGGSTDLLARMLGEKISARLGQPFIVENRPGAAANIAAAYVAKSPADGYTLLLGTSAALAVNPILYKGLTYSPSKDFRPVVLATLLPGVVVVNQSTPVKTFKELAPYLASKGDAVSFASNGVGTPPHLGGELYKKLANLPSLVHVPYQGGGPALAGLVGNQTTMMVAAAPEVLPLIKAGKLRPLAIASTKRLTQLPDVPTAEEVGMQRFDVVLWYAFVAPAATPTPIVAKLNAAFNEALMDPQVKTRLTDMGYEVAGGAPAVLDSKMKSEAAFWAKVIKDANITMD